MSKKYITAIGNKTTKSGESSESGARVATRSGGEDSGKDKEIVAFWIIKDSSCSECCAELGKGSFIRMEKGNPLCMECADLGHLVFLPRGDTALTRRSREHSKLSAVVVRFSRTRGRYERQGLLVEPKALERAEKECLGDEERRRVVRERAAEYREQADERYVAQFAEKILSIYPDCPREESHEIAAHACLKHSGRVGRSAAAKEFDAEAINLAVKAHVRHTQTQYDRLLAQGWERSDARAAVADLVAEVMRKWRRSAPMDGN